TVNPSLWKKSKIYSSVANGPHPSKAAGSGERAATNTPRTHSPAICPPACVYSAGDGNGKISDNTGNPRLLGPPVLSRTPSAGSGAREVQATSFSATNIKSSSSRSCGLLDHPTG